MSNNSHQAGYKQHVIQTSTQTGHRQAERDTILNYLMPVLEEKKKKKKEL